MMMMVMMMMMMMMMVMTTTRRIRYIPVRYVQLCMADIRQAILNSVDIYIL
jgi:hypothetical protein